MYTLGIDSSTQSVKALVWDADAHKVAATASVNFGRELAEFGCPDGLLPNDDVLVRQANPCECQSTSVIKITKDD